MKRRTVYLLCAMLSACAGQTPVPQNPESTLKTDAAKPAQAEAKPPCVDPNPALSDYCSETVTAGFDKQGVLWIAWVSNDQVYVQSSLDKGLSFGKPVLVNLVPEKVEAKGEYRPKIKSDGQGNVFLTWTTKLEAKHTGNIRFSRSSDGGRHFTAPATLNSNLEIISHRFDSMALGENGEIFVAWLDARDKVAAKQAGQDFTGSSLYYTWSDNHGRSFYPNQRISAHSCECCRLATAITPDNTPAIVWRHVFDGGIRDHALVKFKDWQAPGEIQRMGYDNWKIDACPHHGPSLSVANNGVYHGVWFTNSPTRQGLFYANSKDNGEHFSDPVNFGQTGTGHPDVLALGNMVYVVWQAFDGQENRIQLMRSTDQGETWSEPKTIAVSAKAGDQPFLAADGSKAYLAWKLPAQNFRLVALN